MDNDNQIATANDIPPCDPFLIAAKQAEREAKSIVIARRLARQKLVFSMACACGAVIAIAFAAVGLQMLTEFVLRISK